MKNLFFEGPSGCGKTSLILSKLGRELLIGAGGYLTVRLHNEDGSRAGFRVIRACEAVSPDELLTAECANVFIRITSEGRHAEYTVFSDFVHKVLKEREKVPFLLLDELGGIELMDRTFTEKLIEIMQGPIPVIGVLKSRNNAVHMAEKLSLGEEYMSAYETFRKQVSEDAFTEIIDMQKETVAEARKFIDKWLADNNLLEHT